MQSSKKPYVKLYVTGKAMYPKVHSPQAGLNKEEPPTYSLDLIVDKKTSELLKSHGLKQATQKVDELSRKLKSYPEHPGDVYTLRRKTKTKDGKDVSPLVVLDGDLNTIPPSVLIGNGSLVQVEINPYKTVTPAGVPVQGCALLGVQVLELVPYESGKGVSGFTKKPGTFSVGQHSIGEHPIGSPPGVEDDSEDPFGE